MNRFFRISTLVAFAGLMLGAASTTQAAFMTGTIGIADLGTPTFSGGATLSSAMVFNFSDLNTTLSVSGDFATIPSTKLDLGAASLNLVMPTMFTFGNATFGRFTATSVVTTFSSDQTRSFNITGTFVSGTNFGLPTTTNTASFIVSFNNNSTSSGSSLTDSGSLSVPAISSVPEPASVAMLGLSLVGLAGYSARRKLSK